MNEALFVILLVFGMLIGTISGGVRFYNNLMKKREAEEKKQEAEKKKPPL